MAWRHAGVVLLFGMAILASIFWMLAHQSWQLYALVFLSFTVGEAVVVITMVYDLWDGHMAIAWYITQCFEFQFYWMRRPSTPPDVVHARRTRKRFAAGVLG